MRARDLSQTDEAMRGCYFSGSCEKLHSNLRHQSFVAVADYGIDAGQLCQLLWRALCVTASDHNTCGGIDALDSPQIGARRALRLFRNSAGVQYHHGGLGCGSRVATLRRERSHQCIAVSKTCPAPKVFNVVFCHVPQSSAGGYQSSRLHSQARSAGMLF